MSAPRRSHPDEAATRRSELVHEVLEIQRTIRSCEGCGLCCTQAHNSMQILPIEGRRIAGHLSSLAPERAQALEGRLTGAVRTFDLRPSGRRRKYRCPFLEPDLSCALPFEVKPVACLAFNPVHPDHCEMDVARFARAHDPVEAENRRAGLDPGRAPIPVAVLLALGSPSPKPIESAKVGEPARQRRRKHRRGPPPAAPR